MRLPLIIHELQPAKYTIYLIYLKLIIDQTQMNANFYICVYPRSSAVNLDKLLILSSMGGWE